jgi:hypothetical protein
MSGKQTQTDERNKGDRKMRLLTPEENRFLDAFLHEATTARFTGPATKVLHKNGSNTETSRTSRGLLSRRSVHGRWLC